MNRRVRLAAIDRRRDRVPWTRRPMVALAAALLVASSGGPARGQDLGQEWRSIGISETSLIFTAPGLEAAGKRFMLSRAEDYSHTLEVGIWSSRSSLFPKAQLFLQKLSPGYSFTYGIEIERLINNLKFVRGKNPKIGERKSGSNKIGGIEYRQFSFDAFQCIAFGQNFGAPAPEGRVLDYLDLLVGYYCGESGQTLTADSISEVIAGIGVKSAATR